MTILAFALATVTVAAPPNKQLLVDANWLHEHRNDKQLVILHVTNQAAEYEARHIPGARLLLWDAFVLGGENVYSELPSVEALKAVFESVGVSDQSTVVVYGGPLYAARAFMTLEYLGHRDVRLLDGGLAGWTAAGFPESTEAIKAARGTLTPSVRDFVVDADWVNAHRTKRDVVVIDARPLNEFTGDDKGHNGLTTGHIPGAQNIYWQRLVRSADQPFLLPEAQLRDLWVRAGATDGKTVVVYCTLGMRASFSYFVSRYLGYETKFYDGSWVDWSTRQLPLVKGGEPVK